MLDSSGGVLSYYRQTPPTGARAETVPYMDEKQQRRIIALAIILLALFAFELGIYVATNGRGLL